MVKFNILAVLLPPLSLEFVLAGAVIERRVAVDGDTTLNPIATDSAEGIAGGLVNCVSPPLNSFFAGLKPPYPTNSWWAPFAAPPGNATAAGPFPYESSLDGNGIVFGISTNRQMDGTSIKQPTQKDWKASFIEHSGSFINHKAVAFDTQSVTIQYFQYNASMTAYLVPGSPYLTFQYNASTPILTSNNGGIKAFNGLTLKDGQSVNATGTTFNVTDNKDATYIIYALSPISLTATSGQDGGSIRANSIYSGVLRLVKLDKPAHQALLNEHSNVYPTSVKTSYSFANNTAILSFDWKVVGDGGRLLMLTWPHHRQTLQNANYPDTSSLSYLTTKGWMYPAIGNRWQMLHQLSSVTWSPGRNLDESCVTPVLQGLEYEVAQLNVSDAPVPGDFYFWGGTLAATARLAIIADDLKRTDLVKPVVEYLKASFDHWFQPSSTVLPAYESTWGGVINKAGANNVWVDFGNGFYNDHHFHYGYFLTVAAVIAKFDKEWLKQHKDYINWFARDIINPSDQDPYFPITRCRDWFSGHSWASGIANGAGSRDQESVGEAINGYYGALLWASVALSSEYVNFAKLLVATEQHAAKVYWHLYPDLAESDRDNAYPEPEIRKLVTMGNVLDWQAGAWLFWGNEKVQIAAIQILPLTPINEELYDDKWVRNVWNYTMPELLDPAIGDEWKCVIIAAYANSDPQTAAAWSANLTTWGSGNTFTNELYFIGTRPNPKLAPICGTLPQNPIGSFRLQDSATGRYVVASANNTNLVASDTNQESAAVFKSGYAPNSGMLQLVSTGQYVTADQSGKDTLDAARPSANAWERFVIRQKPGASPGIYSIKAASNGLYLTVGADGSLVNSGTNESAGTGFKFLRA
ncbi:glycoside hydrolase family 81 protein [Pochonia chlamydosporia 170]|uniref:glucan endo-1,3-beta-D-glucosidase n=1 Tax=Pochonia chlamydosporia 170 TaxID=1380566 RepID=A0A179F925_METCM|nr:glycoside hydrolase family 81 protein [Pochonia chlamydosporia 170]OAQ61840.2 glycoside hydrolase family 81 protein [Pochonia chlamydosporia 170]